MATATVLTVLYEARVEEIGPMVPELLEAGILIFFGKQAPPELREIAIVHDGVTLVAPLAPQDIIQLGDARYTVTGVGEVASANFSQLGHIVIKANGAIEVELPGEVSVEAGALHLPEIGFNLLVLRPGQAETTSEASSIASPLPEALDQSPAESLSITPTPPQHHLRRSLWAFLSAWRNLKRRATPSG